uniref:Kit ligand n=1 Tax=Amphilophus citrinellus TaxID=61819 RepID=A0A3Q0SI29_AMPCI
MTCLFIFILKVPCLLLSLLTNLNLCFGQYWSPITDDLERVPQVKQNFPNDYEIPLSSIPKDVAGTCWMTLNLYPLEESLERLSSMFGEKSTNRESLLIFIIVLQSIREMIMQDYDCHFQEQRLQSGPYFDYLGNFLRLADREIFDFSCVAPPCPSTQPTHTTAAAATPQGTSQPPQCLRTQQTPEDNSGKWTLLLFVVIPFTACVAVLVWMVSETLQSIFLMLTKLIYSTMSHQIVTVLLNLLQALLSRVCLGSCPRNPAPDKWKKMDGLSQQFHLCKYKQN